MSRCIFPGCKGRPRKGFRSCMKHMRHIVRHARTVDEATKIMAPRVEEEE